MQRAAAARKIGAFIYKSNKIRIFERKRLNLSVFSPVFQQDKQAGTDCGAGVPILDQICLLYCAGRYSEQ